MSYPPYTASLFASNDFCRSAMAFGAILFSRPMYINLGIGQGSSLLAGLSVLGIVSAGIGLTVDTESLLMCHRLVCGSCTFMERVLERGQSSH